MYHWYRRWIIRERGVDRGRAKTTFPVNQWEPKFQNRVFLRALAHWLALAMGKKSAISISPSNFLSVSISIFNSFLFSFSRCLFSFFALLQPQIPFLSFKKKTFLLCSPYNQYCLLRLHMKAMNAVKKELKSKECEELRRVESWEENREKTRGKKERDRDRE